MRNLFTRILMNIVRFSRKAFPVTVFFIVLSLSCLFPLATAGPEKPFQFAIAGTSSDTISPFGPLFLKFGSPVNDPDSVHFAFSPSFSECQVLWSDSRDTAKLYFVLPLEGNMKYSLGLANKIESTDGRVLYPWRDTLKIVTHCCEQEPNGSKDLADFLNSTVFGRIAMANDTDLFQVSDTVKRSFYLKSTGSTSTYTISDKRNLAIKPDAYAAAETLSVPMDFVPPLYIKVFAYNHSNGGSYELGWTKR